jgi:hypothetical protein
VDIGKHHHHAVVVDGGGDRLSSRRVANDEPDLLASGNLHRPRRYHRGMPRVFYTSALISIRCACAP